MAFLLLHSFIVFLLSSQLSSALNSTIDFTVESSLVWSNSNSSNIQSYDFDRNHLVRAILFTKATPSLYGELLTFAFGFYCNRRLYDSCLLAVMILEIKNSSVRADRAPQVVWMANQDHLVKDNATLRVVPDKGLVLTDSNGTRVWSTNTSAYSVGGMTLRSNGNLVLFNSSNSTVWKSFSHPVDTLLMGQELRGKKKLTSTVAHIKSNRGKFFMSLTNSSLTAYVRYKRPVAYAQLPLVPGDHGKLQYVRFNPTSISFFYKKRGKVVTINETLSHFPSVQLLRLDPDGGPVVYIWQPETGWGGLKYSLGTDDLCQKPQVCGKYAVCLDGECSCPKASNEKVYFTPIYSQSPGRGCRFTNALRPNETKYKLRLENFGALSYFSYFDPTAAITGLTELESCKLECRRSSSCKGVFFKYGSNVSDGLCYLPKEILSIRGLPIEGDRYNRSVAFLKVPIPNPPKDLDEGSSGFFSPSMIKKAFSIAASVGACTVILGFIFWKIRRKYRGRDGFDNVFGVPARFSYKELCVATGKFTTVLGRGGFGTVYKGELKDGTVIAVKRLDSMEQQTNEFVSEMKTMGSIHHIHLVKLIGFCAEESNRLLVYQYMRNGSLDKWIFHPERKESLCWETRRKIILDVAKGLAYLHEDCSERIAHFDVKPHNILLDENFNAKISDFGLARFIDRNQSHLVTGMKGTFGYLAPEWQHLKITVKADIYSFGIVILETVSGRMVLDYSLEKSDVHLLGVLQRLARDDRIIDIVDKKIADWESNQEDILEMIDIAVWCLHEDQTKRPSMSTVVKILEGTMEFEQSIEFKFHNALVLSGGSPASSCSDE